MASCPECGKEIDKLNSVELLTAHDVYHHFPWGVDSEEPYRANTSTYALKLKCPICSNELFEGYGYSEVKKVLSEVEEFFQAKKREHEIGDE